MKRFLDKLLGEDNKISENKQTGAENIQIATVALLLEIASADDEFSSEERGVIVKALKSRFELSVDEVDKILEMTTRELDSQVDFYYFTNQINENFDVTEKITIIEMVWRVIYSDRHLNGHEDFLVHRFAKLLRLDHGQMIEAKLRIKKELFSEG